MSDDNSDINDFETRWPMVGDQLFVESAWAYDAQVVRDPRERFYRMPMGYKRAGDLLIDQAASKIVDRKNIIYAALFCYRQSIELYLKRVIDEFGKGKVYSPKNTHDLSKLWVRFIDVLKERGDGDEIGLSVVEKLVTEMHEADQKSDGFRYPAATDGVPFLFGDQGINLANTREVMQGVANFFECDYEAFLQQDYAASE